MNVPKEAFQKQFFALLPIYVNLFMSGCADGWLSNAIYFFQNGSEISATVEECAFIASFSETGRVIFAIPGAILVEKFGRKKVITSAGTAYVVSWVTISLNSSLNVIYICRLLLGIANSMVNVTSMIFLVEVASAEVRGKLIGFCQIAYFVGVISESILTVSFSSYRTLSYYTAAFSFLYFISAYWLMETPHYLISVSKLNQARRNLRHVRLGYPESAIDEEFDKLQKYIKEEKFRKDETRWLEFIMSESIRKPVITCLLIYFFTSANGVNTLTVDTTLANPDVGFVPLYYYPLIGQLIQLVVSLCIALYIDRYPRRRIYFTGSCLIAIVMTFCAITNYRWKEHNDSVSKWLFLIGNIFTMIVHSASTQPLGSALRSEILPQGITSLGGSLAIIAQAVASAISFQLYYLIGNNFSLYYLYVIFSINSWILCIIVYFRLPESRGKLLADLHSNNEQEVGLPLNAPIANHDYS